MLVPLVMLEPCDRSPTLLSATHSSHFWRPSLTFFVWVWFVLFETGIHISQGGPQLAMEPKITSNFWASWVTMLSLCSARDWIQVSSLIFIVISSRFRHTTDIQVWVSLRVFSGRFNWAGKAHPEWGQQHSMGWHQGGHTHLSLLPEVRHVWLMVVPHSCCHAFLSLWTKAKETLFSLSCCVRFFTVMSHTLGNLVC